MEFKGIKIDLVGLAQVLLGAAALVTAWRSRKIAKEKADAKDKQDSGS